MRSSLTRTRALAAATLVASLVVTGPIPASAEHTLVVDPGVIEVVEGGDPVTFSVSLAEDPTDSIIVVSVSVISGDPGEVEISPTELTFDVGNWNVAQEVTVTAVDDDVDDGDQLIEIGLSIWDQVQATVLVTTIDDDTAGLDVTQPADPIVTSEAGDQQVLTVALTSRPIGSVTIHVVSSDETEAVVDVEVLEFDSEDWSHPQEITVTGVDDAVVDGDTAYTIVLSTSTSADATYAALADVEIQGINLDDVHPPAPVEAPSSPFTDIGDLPESTRDAIETLVRLGITTGTSDGVFSPAEVVTRWQMALFLTRQLVAHGVALPVSDSPAFLDVASLDDATRDAIARLATLEVTRGTSNEAFDPHGSVTRWQMALFMARVLVTAGVVLPTEASDEFGDLDSLDAETRFVIRQLTSLGVVEGVGGDRFDPHSPVTRWQMALFIVRTLRAVDHLD